MSVSLSPIGGAASQFFNSNGVPLSGGKIYTYEAGTTTPKATYTSANGLTAHSNPIILDSTGRVPGGEIWLTTAQAYLFILKASNGTLIGTWDNIYGYSAGVETAVTEVQVATAGQTDFVLTSMIYTPGTNTLGIYIDGVNQVVNNAYTEVSATTVTFVSGLHLGATVKFIQINSAATDSNLVTYTPAGAGAVATTVQAKLRESVSVKDFGAVGDGVTDNAVAFALAASAVASGGTLIIPKGAWNYSDGLTFTTPVGLMLDPNAVLNYTGTGYAVQLGAIGNISQDIGNYSIDGGCFIGGTTATQGIYITPFTVFPKIQTRFLNFGNTTNWAIFAQVNNWQVLIWDCEYLNNTNTAKNFTRINGHSVGGVSDGGNSHLTAYGNNITSIAAGGGVGIWNSGAGDLIYGNKIEGFSPNIRVGYTAAATRIYGNYFECLSSAYGVNGNCIEFSDPAGGFVPSGFIVGLSVDNNYCNMHSTDGLNNNGNFIAPSGTASGVQNSSVQNNQLAAANTAYPLVRQNNLFSQVGNAGLNNYDVVSGVVPLHSIFANVNAWKGEEAQSPTLSTNVSPGGGNLTPKCSFDSSGVVHLSGVLLATTGVVSAGTSLITLPLGYAPIRNVLMTATDGATGTTYYLNISTNAVVTSGITLQTSSALYLDSVSYRVSN